MDAVIHPRLTFARLVLELRRRVGAHAIHPQRLADVLTGLRELAAKTEAPESEPLGQILAALLGVHRALELEGRALDLLSPETVLRLDAVLAALLGGSMQEDELRAQLRRAVIRPAS